MINDFVVGAMITETLVVKSATARETKAKKPYLAMEFFDGVDIIGGNYWDWASGSIPPVNSVLDVTAQVTEYLGTKQLNIKTLKDSTTRHLADFAPKSNEDLDSVYREAYSLLTNVQDDALRAVGLGIFEELSQAWLTVPGAISVHHAYIGGTLIHSLSVAKIALAIAETIPEANKDLCLVGALLHDVGKLYTYKLDGVNICMTEEGQLYDHVFIGAEFVGNYAMGCIDCDIYQNIKKIEMLRHIILSHHSRLEYGSPVYPLSIEAYIVSHADGIDAAVEQIRAAARKVPNTLKWTDRIYTLNNRPHLTPYFVNTVMEQ